MQILGTLQPVRFQPRYEALWEDISVTAGMTEPVQVEAVEPAGDLVLASIQTSTRTLIADGFLSHNCIQGTARELLVDGVLRWKDTRWGHYPLLPIHDEVFAFVPLAEAEEALATLIACMRSQRFYEIYGVPIEAAGEGPFQAWPDSS
jgi:hypothetical protein